MASQKAWYESDDEDEISGEEPAQATSVEPEADKKPAEDQRLAKAPALKSREKPDDGDFTNQDKLAMALIALAGPIIGGAMGGKVGAYGGAATGAKAVSGIYQDKAAEDKAKKIAGAKEAARLADRKQDMDDFEKKERFKNGLKPIKDAKEPKIHEYEDAKGNTRIGKLVDGKLIKSPDDETVKNAKPDKGDALSTTDYGKAAQAAGDKFRDDAAKPRMAMEAAKDAENLVKLAEKNPAAAAAAIRKLARASGDSGVMSDADVEAFGGSQSMTDKFARMMERAKNGTMTADDVKYATEVAQVLGANAQVAYEGMADDAVNRFQANFKGDPDDIYMRLTGKPRSQPKEKVPTDEDAPPPAKSAPTLQDLQAEKDRRLKERSQAGAGKSK